MKCYILLLDWPYFTEIYSLLHASELIVLWHVWEIDGLYLLKS